MRNYFYLLLAFTLIPICSFAQIFGGQLKSAKAGTIGSLNCITAANNGTLTPGTTASNVSSIVPYTGGNGGRQNGQIVNSTGVTGLSAVLTAGSFANGAGTLTYIITGMPATSGTASFALSIGGQSCTLTRGVANASSGCGNQSTVTDIDGNVYPVVEIGTQCWMKENLKVSKYRNGDPIPTNLTNAAWITATTGAYAIYNNDAVNNTTYGKLYNWYAVADSRNLCPVGWHVPTDAEWTTLENFLGGIFEAGGKLKSTSSLWTAPNTGATNESGFTGLPGGFRFDNVNNGVYDGIRGYGYWWSSTENLAADAWLLALYSNYGQSIQKKNNKQFGFSVRCLKDAPETGSINNLDCGGAVNTGTLTQGIAETSVSSTVPYTGGNGGTYTAKSITSTGVTGLTATLAAGTLLSGAGGLIYNISGTPASSGTASFVLSIGGQSCTLTRAVANASSGCGNLSTLTDIDGNVYPVVEIGTQCWMKENLKVSKYRYGDPIPTNLTDAAWSATTIGAYAIYNNDPANNTTYGKLYNWYAVADSRNLCPVGWHVPSDGEWKRLEISLGMSVANADLTGGRGIAQNVGGKLKSTSSQWLSPNIGATNESGFSGLPGGYRYYDGTFKEIGQDGNWWSTTEYSVLLYGWYRYLEYPTADSYRFEFGNKPTGISVRCLRDATETGNINNLDCGGAVNSGTLTQGVAAASVSSSVPYTGGNGGTYSTKTITSTGVTGLSATLAAGTLLSGAGSLNYTITGTPASSGVASFALSLGGQTCTLTRTVALAIGTITALSCSTATNNGTLTQGVAAASASSSVPYTGGNGGTYSAQTVTSTGVTGLTATLVASTLFNGAGSVTYTITGTPATSGTASFAFSLGGQTCTLTRTVALPLGTITALSCATATNSGTLTQGVAAASVNSSVPYTGGNGGTYTAQAITSTGVTGLTATLAAGTLLSGAGNLTYTITGTPATSGTASFALNIGGQTCTLTRTVALPVGTITALSCSTATNSGTLTQDIAAASVSSSVPYTGGNGGTYTAQNITSTGVTGLTATLAAGTLLSGAGSVSYTITGTPATSGTASFALSLGGQTCSLTRTVIGLASLSTTAASTITSTTASSGGNITADGGSAITARGVCWSTSANPTIALTTKTSNGTGTGTFSSSLTILSQNTLYYVRAYATNSVGTAYGSQVSFTTAVSTNPTDVDGNTYTTVTIGTQVWMKENLKVSKYRNGDPIPTNLTDASWQATTSGAYAIYNNDAANNTTYGKLYNWYAVVDSRNLCPVGWHVPSDPEWKTLEIYLGMSVTDADIIGSRGSAQNIGGKLKSTSTLWTAPNTGATNESGFSGLPGGYRDYFGACNSVGYLGAWWSSTETSTTSAWYRYLYYGNGSSGLGYYDKQGGFSVRCLRD